MRCSDTNKCIWVQLSIKAWCAKIKAALNDLPVVRTISPELAWARCGPGTPSSCGWRRRAQPRRGSWRRSRRHPCQDWSIERCQAAFSQVSTQTLSMTPGSISRLNSLSLSHMHDGLRSLSKQQGNLYAQLWRLQPGPVVTVFLCRLISVECSFKARFFHHAYLVLDRPSLPSQPPVSRHRRCVAPRWSGGGRRRRGRRRGRSGDAPCSPSPRTRCTYELW